MALSCWESAFTLRDETGASELKSDHNPLSAWDMAGVVLFFRKKRRLRSGGHIGGLYSLCSTATATQLAPPPLKNRAAVEPRAHQVPVARFASDKNWRRRWNELRLNSVSAREK